MAIPVHEIHVISPGQFDDAEEGVKQPSTSVQPESLQPELGVLDRAPDFDPRAGQTFIDDDPAEAALDWSEEEEEEDPSDGDFGYDEVNEADWEAADGDFTKQYNRLRQHVQVRTGTALGTRSALGQNVSVAPLPAVNRSAPKKATASIPTDDKRLADQAVMFAKFNSRIANISQPYEDMKPGISINRKAASERANVKDKSDRATNEQVLDPRTRIILFKMIGRGLIWEVNGCVSTGKEANVYHALTPSQPPGHLALKIYKTSILVFKDRDRYVTGEHRFRHGYSKRNPRKMVRLWAEKEMRNLKRLMVAGIRCPEPIEVRENVLVMGFLGDKDGWASPRLKDAQIPSPDLPSLPEPQELPDAEDGDSRGPLEGSNQQDDAVFLQSYIPRTLNDVYDPERDIERLQRGEGKDLIYGDLTGVVRINEGMRGLPVTETNGDEDEDEDEDEDPEDSERAMDSSEEESAGEGTGFVEKKARGKKHEDKDAKKERKKATKEEAREKRKHKMPKAEKKRRIKATKS
ncbi:hypothetical protein RSAG8_04984, partial [Rhizoctonia solani AG-8 WAC10335]